MTKSFTIHARLVKTFVDVNYELEDEIQTELEKLSPNSKFDIHGGELKIAIEYKESGENLGDIVQLFEDFQAAGKITGLRVTSKNLEDIFNQLNRINNPNQASGLYKHYQKNQNGVKQNGNGKYPLYNGNSDNKTEKPSSEKRMDLFRVVMLLLWKRWTHFLRNYRLLITILVLPAVFEIIAMSFMTLRPPDEFGVALKFSRDLYPNSNQFFSYEEENEFSKSALGRLLLQDNNCVKNNTEMCTQFNNSMNANEWILKTHKEFIEKRYTGSTFNGTRIVTWYNNKGYHSMPVQLNQINSALFKSEMDDNTISISTINHPLKLGDKELSQSSM